MVSGLYHLDSIVLNDLNTLTNKGVVIANNCHLSIVSSYLFAANFQITSSLFLIVSYC